MSLPLHLPPSMPTSRTPDPVFGLIFGIIGALIVGVLALVVIVFHPSSLPTSTSDVQSQINNITLIIQNELNAVGCPSGGVLLPKTICYPNVDGDISGDPNGTPVYTCGACPAGYINNNFDCNDTNAAIFRGSVVCESNDLTNRLTLIPYTDITAGIGAQVAPNTGHQCPDNNGFRWGSSLWITGNLLVSGAPCRSIVLVWEWHEDTGTWIADSVALSNTNVNSTVFGQFVSTDGTYVMVGRSSNGSNVAGFDIYKRNSPLSYTLLTLTTGLTTHATDTIGSIVAISNGLTAAMNVDLGLGTGGAVLGHVSGLTYTEWNLCDCSTQCPGNGWSTVVVADNFCDSIVSTTTTIDRLDGTYAAFAVINAVYFFNWNGTFWNYVSKTLNPPLNGTSPSGIDIGSMSMYNRTLAVGVYDYDITAQRSIDNTTACLRTLNGAATWFTPNAANTVWTPTNIAVFSPNVCQSEWCGTSISLWDTRVIVGCPHFDFPSGNGDKNGNAFVFDIRDAYNTHAQQYEGTLWQEYNTTSTQAGGQSVAVSENFYAMGTPGAQFFGYNIGIGGIVVTTCTNVTTC